MRRILAFVTLLLLFFGTTDAQKRKKNTEEQQYTPQNFVEKLRSDYQSFYAAGGIFEKLYIATDKPYYSAGETLYYSGFLVHSIYFTRTSRTAFIYVELIAPDGTLVSRSKVAATDHQFVGTFELPTRLTSGKYTLRAYSKWMTNFDLSYFFTKEVFIGNYIDNAIITSTTYSVADTGEVTATIRFADTFSLPIVASNVKCRVCINSKNRYYNLRTAKDGTIKLKFMPSNCPSDGIEVNIRANSRDLSRFIQLPSFSADFDVQFLPEGGNLIAGRWQVIAFKAQAVNGHSVEIKGKIYDNFGKEIANIESEHCGMGSILFRAHADKSYYAVVQTKDCSPKRFTLPKAYTTGAVLKVMPQADGYMIATELSPDLDITNYAVVIHSRGAVMTVIEDLSHPYRILNKDLYDGIAQVSVVNKISCKVVAERLFYVRDNHFAKAKLTTPHPTYNCREKVEMDIQVVGSDGNPKQGNFALTVTDNSVVKWDKNATDIFSYMLLCSDLRGEVENPGYYFDLSNANVTEYLDLVMLTSGWRRYSLEDIMAGEHPQILYPMEDSQMIRGSVSGLFGRAKKPSLFVMDTKSKWSELFELNEYNNFIISGLDAFSTTSYIIQALNRKGKDRYVGIKIDTDNYPLLTLMNHREYYKNPIAYIPESLLTRAKERYYAEGGEKIIDIEEIIVTAKRVKDNFHTTADTGSVLSGDLTRFANIYDALSTFKELDIVGTTIKVTDRYRSKKSTGVENAIVVLDSTDNGENDSDNFTPVDKMIQELTGEDDDSTIPLLIINGQETSIDFIDNYKMQDIEKISYIRPSSATMLGISGANGAIVMEVSKAGIDNAFVSGGMAKVVVKGCNKPKQFYKPKYPTYADKVDDKINDMRNTIAWEPLIRTDSTGLAKIWFYTADRSTTYDLIMEGITDEGELCRKTTTLNIVRKGY